MRRSPATKIRSTTLKVMAGAVLGATLLLSGCGGGGGGGGGTTPPPATFTLGGTITGLGANSGLVLVNGGTTLAIPAGATSFSFPTPLPSGTAYAVSVQTQPTGLTCTVAGGTGTLTANVSNVAVTCSNNTYTLGGSITGLGADSGMVLTNESADPTTIPANATTFTMSSPVPYGAPYSIAVARNPTALACSVTNATGTMPAGNVTNVSVGCLAGSVSILASLGGTGDGSKPYGNLIQATDGNLYGMTQHGGANGNGAVIKLTPTGTESVLYSFAASGDGTNPQGSLVQATDGKLYGMTPSGGANATGTVFAIDLTSGTESVIHNFGGPGDGTAPYGSLIQASDGNLYGMTSGGGANGAGTVFEINLTTGTESVIHSFGGPGDGSAPYGTLIQASDGNLYGTTVTGGANGTGAVIKLTLATPTESVVYSFAATGDGTSPYGALLQASDGNLYGLTQSGGANNAGVAFRLQINPSVTETILHTFGGSGDGLHPFGGLIQASDGNLYGLTQLGGSHNFGILFKMTLTGTETILHSFGASGDGSQPYGSLLQASSGGLYGTTTLGGTHNLGTIFELN